MLDRLSSAFFWQKLWIREDEFHPSLDQDIEVMSYISFKRRRNWIEQSYADQAYRDDLLCRRREIAHNRTIDTVSASAG